MAVARGHVQKTSLTPRERLVSAYLYLCRGVAQHDIAAAFGVNSGRVADAIKACREAVDWPAPDDPEPEPEGDE